MAKPKVQSLSSAINSLNPAYSSSKKLLNQQIAGISGNLATQTQGLDVAKENSFRDINRGMNARGVAFSGLPAEEQTRYLGEKYLPAVAGLKSQANEQRLTLQQALAGISREQRLKAMDIRDRQQARLEDYLKEQRQLALERERMAMQAASSGGGYGGSRSNGVDIQLKKNKNGGWTVLENGKPSTQYDLATASKLLGRDLIGLLKNGDKQDRQAAKYYEDNIRLGRGAKYAKQRLAVDRGSAFYLGGYY